MICGRCLFELTKPISARYLSMSVEEKRQKYKCGQNYVTLSEVPTWPEYAKEEGLASSSGFLGRLPRL